MNVLLCAHAASEKWGGEAILPLHVFRGLQAKGHKVWLSLPADNQDEIQACLAGHTDRILFMPRSRLGNWIDALSRSLPSWFPRYLILFLGTIEASIHQRSAVKKLVRELSIDVVHVVTPVSPKLPSFIFNVGAPCIFGSMNGGMAAPPGLTLWEPPLARALRRMAKALTGTLNVIMPGKRCASALVFANKRSAAALAFKPKQQIFFLIENGLHDKVWDDLDRELGASEPQPAESFRFLFVGSLQLWKGSETVLRAFAKLNGLKHKAICTIVGPGEENRQKLLALARELGVEENVQLPGYLPQLDCFRLMQRSHAFVFPSVLECGGAVVMEAMRAGLPVIAVNWGGPADYLNAQCGILVEPTGKQNELVDDVARQMQRLLEDAELCQDLGAHAKQRAKQFFSWNSKIDAYLQIYQWARTGGSSPITHPAVETH